MQKGVDYGLICDVAGKGKGNEDSAFFTIADIIIAPGSPLSKSFSQKVILGIVADGVSGSAKGEQGSTFAIRHMASKILDHLYLDNVDIAQIHLKLTDFLQQTNLDFLAAFKDMIEKEHKIPKTTIVGILIIGQWIWVFNLGDSRAFLIRDKQISQISIDHIGTIAHEITQAIGEPTIKPHIAVYNWAFTDHAATIKAYQNEYYALICSDGLTDVVNSEEINQILSEKAENLDMQKKVEKLYDLAITRKINDNVSIIAIDLAGYLSGISPIQILKLSYE